MGRIRKSSLRQILLSSLWSTWSSLTGIMAPLLEVTVVKFWLFDSRLETDLRSTTEGFLDVCLDIVYGWKASGGGLSTQKWRDKLSDNVGLVVGGRELWAPTVRARQNRIGRFACFARLARRPPWWGARYIFTNPNSSPSVMVAEKLEWSAIDGQEHPVLGPAWKSNGHVFTSGIVGQNYTTGEIPESLEEQTELAIANVKRILEASGSSLDKVFKVMMFISHADYKTFNEIYGKYFPQKPARSCVIAAFMDARIKVELEVIATTD